MNKYIIISLCVIVYAACKSHKQMARDQIKLKLDSVELSFKDKRLNNDLLYRTGNLMDAYSRQFADDTLAPYFLFKSAEMFADQQDYDAALRKYNDVRVRFPKSTYSSKALFTMAFMYDNMLHNKVKAKEFYKMFIDKYPSDTLASSAKASIETMDIPIDTLVKRFEHKQDSIKNAKRS